MKITAQQKAEELTRFFDGKKENAIKAAEAMVGDLTDCNVNEMLNPRIQYWQDVLAILKNQ
jgi:hypothetical protein